MKIMKIQDIPDRFSCYIRVSCRYDWDYSDNKTEITNWLQENIKDSQWKVGLQGILFKDENDALMFKLRWE